MKKLLCVLLCMLLLCACGAPAAPEMPETPVAPAEPAVEADYQVGYGRVDISPADPIVLRGYSDAKNRVSTAVADPLYATAIAITDQDGNSALFITADHCAIYWNFANEARDGLAEKLGISADNIVISATHTHSAPDISNAPAYTKVICDGIIAAGEAAWADRKGASLYTAKTETEGLNFVRHYVYADGQIGTLGGIQPEGTPVGHTREADGEMRLMHFKRAEGKDIVMMNFQVHAVLASYNVSPKTEVTADLVGGVRAYLEKNLDCHFAYFQGAAGDLNPDSWIPGEHETKNIYRYGKMLGDYAIEALNSEVKQPAGKIEAKGFTVDMPIDHSDAHLAPLAQQVQDEINATGKQHASNELARSLGFVSFHQAQSVLRRLNMGESRKMYYSVLSVGDIGFTAAPLELYCVTGKTIREGSPYGMTFVIGYANGNWSYLPAEYAFTEYYSYEAGICNYAPGSAEMLADTFIKELNELKGE